MPGEPTEPAGSAQQSSEFPSITRAEQAKQLQSELQDIAQQGGWQPPKPEGLPKADGTGGLAEGTPLASKDSLTPGQKARVEDLSARKSIRVESTHNDQMDKTKLARMGAVAKEVRDRADSPGRRDDAILSERTAAHGSIGELYPQAYLEASRNNTDVEEVRGRMLDERFGPDTVTDRTPFDRQEDIKRKILGRNNWGKARMDDELQRDLIREGRIFDRMHEELRHDVHNIRAQAADVYDLNPERFGKLEAREFLEILKAYQDEKAKSAELRSSSRQLIGDMEQLDKIAAEGGSAADQLKYIFSVAPGLTIGDDETPRVFVERVRSVWSNALDKAQAEVDASERRMDSIIRGNEEAASHTDTQSQTGAENSAAEQPHGHPDDHMAYDHDGIERGYN